MTLLERKMDATAGFIWDVKTHGATGDRETNDGAAIQTAIDACHGAGGGVPGRRLPDGYVAPA